MGYRTYTCPIAKSCGGCEWLAVPYPIQLERKQALVEEVLGQAVRRDGATLEKICGMDEPRGYRHKAATPFAPGSHGRVRCGFYAAGSHRIVPCSSCLVEAPGARDVLNAVARAAERCKISAYQEDRGSGILRHAVVRMGYATRECLLTIVTNGPRLPRAEKFLTDILRNQPQVTSVVQNINERRTNAILGRACV
ncbi:MAG: 23S rRNA (uracil-5-)-methyltransferase RumA, partial [Olsenella sp.]|nr:23S rRNA (uracil-5-)-methyltransferase RumA [Olsenella sp.]